MADDMPDDVEGRLRLLESHVEVQEAVIIAMQAERIESQRLSDSVSRLGDGAVSLSEALLQVDRNQQALTRLGTQLSDVKETIKPKAELETEREATEAELRRGHVRSVVIAILVLVLAMGGVAGGFKLRENQQRDAYRNCLTSQRTADGVKAFLDAVSASSADEDLVDAAESLSRHFSRRVACVQP